MHAPLVVLPHDPAWAVAFEREAEAVRQALAGTRIALHHIGSTAIAGILAKPIIDLLGVVEVLPQMDRHTDQKQALGYEVMGAFGIEGRRYFRKFDRGGNRTHHLHVFGTGSPHVERHLAFRGLSSGDALNGRELFQLKGNDPVPARCNLGRVYGCQGSLYHQGRGPGDGLVPQSRLTRGHHRPRQRQEALPRYSAFRRRYRAPVPAPSGRRASPAGPPAAARNPLRRDSSSA